MNFLAHYYLGTRLLPCSELLSPYLIVGTALPDLLPLAATHKRLRLTSLRDNSPESHRAQAVAEGVRMHLLTDMAFHKTEAFRAAQTEVGELISRAGFVGIRVRRFFLAHVLVELTLDALLVRREPHLADDFYDAFDRADLNHISRWIETAVDMGLPALPTILTRFAQSRYLMSYAEDRGVAEGLSQLSLRARQEAFQGDNFARLVSLVSHTVQALAAVAEILLLETASALSGHYPPTTSK